jgi:hypothetical protein
MIHFREFSMPSNSQVRSLPRATAAAAVLVLAALLYSAALPTRAADAPPKAAPEASVKIKTSPPSIRIDATTDDKDDTAANAKDDTEAKASGSRRAKAHIRIDDDEDFQAFTGEMRKNPWVIGLIFLVVGSIFLTPVVLLVGIIWYKLRKTRLQNEAMLRLAEKGVVPPAQAADALASGAAPATVAPQIYQQAVALRKRVVWSDLRKGVILSMVGLAFLLYGITSSGEASWVGLILLFVGVGYVALWWLEGRHLQQTGAPGAGDGAGKGAGGE